MLDWDNKGNLKVQLLPGSQVTSSTVYGTRMRTMCSGFKGHPLASRGTVIPPFLVVAPLRIGVTNQHAMQEQRQVLLVRRKPAVTNGADFDHREFSG